jgi:hypothetical protein
MSKLRLPRAGVVTTRKGHSIARKFGTKGSAVSEISGDPISLVAAEIHLGRWPAGDYGGWPATTYSNSVPAQQITKFALKTTSYSFCNATISWQPMPLRKAGEPKE